MNESAICLGRRRCCPGWLYRGQRAQSTSLRDLYIPLKRRGQGCSIGRFLRRRVVRHGRSMGVGGMSTGSAGFSGRSNESRGTGDPRLSSEYLRRQCGTSNLTAGGDLQLKERARATRCPTFPWTTNHCILRSNKFSTPFYLERATAFEWRSPLPRDFTVSKSRIVSC